MCREEQAAWSLGSAVVSPASWLFIVTDTSLKEMRFFQTAVSQLFAAKRDSSQSPHLPVSSVFVMKPSTWHIFGTCCLTMMSPRPYPYWGSFAPKCSVYGKDGVGWKVRGGSPSAAGTRNSPVSWIPNPWHQPGLLNCLVLEVDVEIKVVSGSPERPRAWTSPGGKK